SPSATRDHSAQRFRLCVAELRAIQPRRFATSHQRSERRSSACGTSDGFRRAHSYPTRCRAKRHELENRPASNSAHRLSRPAECRSFSTTQPAASEFELVVLIRAPEFPGSSSLFPECPGTQLPEPRHHRNDPEPKAPKELPTCMTTMRSSLRYVGPVVLCRCEVCSKNLR